MHRTCILAASLALASCSHDPYVIKQADVGATSLVTDARSRVLVAFPALPASGPNYRRIICAEPSPDVAQAVSDAIKAGLSLDLSKAGATDPRAKTLGFDFGKSSAESIAQLGERLAVVQLLRDRMYRACEAYANRAIGEAAYTLLMARNDKTMMSLLSNELAAGAFGRNLAAISGSASLGGASKEAVKAQEKAVSEAAENLTKAASAEPPKKEDIATARTKLDAELTKLLALDRQVNAAASATATPVGTLGTTASATPRTLDASILQDMQRNYLDDDGIDPLVDACIIGVEHLTTTENKDAQNYLNSIREQYARSKERARSVSESIDDTRKEIALLRPAFVQAEGDMVAAKTAEAKRQPLRFTTAEVATRIAALDADMSRLQERLKELTAERSALEQTKGLEPRDLYMASGSPFAAFCFQSVLAGDSKFMNIRLQQKRRLRGLELSEDAMLSRKLEFCIGITKADAATIDAKTRASLLLTCAEQLKRPAEPPAGAVDVKKS